MENIINLNAETIDYYYECCNNNDLIKNMSVLQWQFFKNNKKNYVSIEYDIDEKKAAAIYATFGVDFKIENKIYLASQSVDTVTDANYRGKGLFIKLAKDVYQKAKDEGVALVYGFPNGNSIHGFKTKLGWEVLDPVPFLIKPLKTSYFTNKLSFLKWLPNINISLSGYSKSKKFIISEVNSFPETVNIIWSNFSKNISIALHRDKNYLDWRYINKPFENYKIAHCYDINDKHLGYIVYAVKGKHGGKIAYIMELIYDPEYPQAAKKLMKFAIHNIKKEKADCILAWNFDHSPSNKVFKNNFFIKMPEKFRPIELHFGACVFNEKLKSTIVERKNWYLSYSDSDTV